MASAAYLGRAGDPVPGPRTLEVARCAQGVGFPCSAVACTRYSSCKVGGQRFEIVMVGPELPQRLHNTSVEGGPQLILSFKRKVGGGHRDAVGGAQYEQWLNP